MPVNSAIESKLVSGTISDCNPGIEFSIPAYGIKKFVIPVSRDPVLGLDLGLQICSYFGILVFLMNIALIY